MQLKSNMRKFYRWPNPARGEFSRPYGGIVEVLRQYSRFLPVFGWSEVDKEDEADLVVGHLGVATKKLDVFHLHGLMPTADYSLTKQDFRTNATIINNIRRAGTVVCVSDWVADILRRDMHMSPEVIGHGFDWDVWQEVPAVSFKDTRPKVLWNKTRNVGVCDPTVVIELAKRIPKVDFVTTFVPKKADNIPSNVKVTGLLARWDAWGLCKAVDIYLGTTKETFGVGAFEAMASGVPIVGFRHGATPEVAGDAGLFVDPGDYDGLAELVKDALRRKEELGKLGIERVRGKYSWSSVVSKVAKVYENALQARGSQSPRVTVVVPCYNRAKFITDTIKSILAQTFEDWELIVVNDASTDASTEAIEEAIKDEKRARLVEHPENRGVAHARNTGIKEGTGEFIWCLDADDSCAPTYLEAMVNGLEKDPKLAIAYTKLRVMDSEGNLRDKVHSWPSAFVPERTGNQIPTSCLYRRIWWERLGGYRQRYAPHGAGQEDADFWMRILANGGGAELVSDEGLFYYRFHPDQVTRVHRDDWKKNVYLDWYPFLKDGQHPMASQLGVPELGSWPVRDYDNPKITVVIPVGPNHGELAVDAIDSVEAQTYRDWDLIIVDDSGQNLDFSDRPYAKVYRTEGKTGPAKARNLGTSHVTTPFVVYLDADDILQPPFLEKTMAAWLRVGGGWVYTDLHYVDGKGENRIHHAPDWDSGRLWRKGIAAVTALYPTEAWKAVGGFNEELQHEDWVFHIDITLAGWCGTRVAEPLITYRHTTGTRRQEGLDNKGFIAIKTKYSEESLMGCGCSKGGGSIATARRPARRAPRRGEEPSLLAKMNLDTIPKNPGGNMVLMAYVGKSQTDLHFRGKSQRNYLFNSKNRQFQWVSQEDARRLGRNAVLQEVDKKQLLAATAPTLNV